MCDEISERDLDAYLKKKALTRRGFNKGASAAVLASGLSVPVFAMPMKDAKPLTETDVMIPTPDGTVDAKFFHPKTSQ